MVINKRDRAMNECIIDTTASVEGKVYNLQKRLFDSFEEKIAESRAILEADGKKILFCPVSFGKDSTYVLNVALEAYKRCIEEGTIEASRPFIVSTGDTLSEAIPMAFYVNWAIPRLIEYSKRMGINLFFNKVTPNFHEEYANKYFTAQKLIPNPTRSGDCSVILKVVPSERFIKSLMKKFKEDEELSQYSSSDIICATGQRVPESTRRSGNMIKQNTANKNIEDLMAEFKASEVKTDYKLYLYAPIRELETDDVFTSLAMTGEKPQSRNLLGKILPGFLPDFSLLLALYGNASKDSCDIAVGSKNSAGCNGSARYGCLNCTMVGARDKTQEALNDLPRWRYLLQDEALRLRDYMYRLSVSNEYRMLHAKSVDSVGYSRIALQPNALKVKYLEKLVRYSAMLSIRSEKNANEFREMVQQGTTDQHPGIQCIKNDLTLNAKARRSMLEMYIEQAQKPAINLFSEKHAVYLSFRWALDGVNAAPYRPLKIWHDLVNGKGWIPFPKTNSEYAALHGNISMKDEKNPLPDAKMFTFFASDGDPKTYVDNYEDLISYWLRPYDESDLLGEANCTVRNLPKKMVPVSVNLTTKHELNETIKGNGLVLHGFVDERRRPICEVNEKQFNLGSILVNGKVASSDFKDELLNKEIHPLTEAYFSNWLTEISNELQQRNFKSTEQAMLYIKGTFEKAFGALNDDGSREVAIEVKLPYFSETNLSQGYQTKTRKVPTPSNFTKRVTKIVAGGKIEKGLTRLRFYALDKNTRAHYAHSDKKTILTPDFACSEEEVKNIFYPSFYMESVDEDHTTNIIITDGTIAQMKSLGFYDNAIKLHDDFLKRNIKNRHSMKETALAKPTIRYGNNAGLAEEMVSNGIIKIAKSYSTTFKRLIRRTQLFDEIGCFDYQHLALNDITHLPFIKSMKQHRKDKAEVLLYVRELRNMQRANVRKMLSNPKINMEERISKFFGLAEACLTHYVDCTFLTSQKVLFASQSMGKQSRSAKTWLMIYSNLFENTAQMLRFLLSKDQLSAMEEDTDLLNSIYAFCKSKQVSLLRTAMGLKDKWKPVYDFNLQFKREVLANSKGAENTTAMMPMDSTDWVNRFLYSSRNLYSGLGATNTYGFIYEFEGNEHWKPNYSNLQKQVCIFANRMETCMDLVERLQCSLSNEVYRAHSLAITKLPLEKRLNLGAIQSSSVTTVKPIVLSGKRPPDGQQPLPKPKNPKASKVKRGSLLESLLSKRVG